MVDRGYKTGRKGQGYGRSLPKRQPCPNCGKKGLSTWKPTPYGCLIRECQYCRHIEKKDL